MSSLEKHIESPLILNIQRITWFLWNLSVYILNNTTGDIRVTDIAQKLDKTKSSVNSAINSLKSEGLINYEPYGQIELTEIGKKCAIKIIEA